MAERHLVLLIESQLMRSFGRFSAKALVPHG